MVTPLSPVAPIPSGQPRATAEPAVTGAPPSPADPVQAPLLNPSLRLDPALNILVIEFRGTEGRVEHSIPSPREMKAYQLAGSDAAAAGNAATAAAFRTAREDPVVKP